MNTFTITRDVVYDGDREYIILSADDLKKLKESAKANKDAGVADFLKQQIELIEADRKANKDKIRTESVVVRKPTPADRIDIRSKSKTNGQYDVEREPLESAVYLIQEWSLQDLDGKPLPVSKDTIGNMPMCLYDLVVNEIYAYLYPSQSRLDFLLQSGA